MGEGVREDRGSGVSVDALKVTEIRATTGRIVLRVERLDVYTWRFTMRGPSGETTLLVDEEDMEDLRDALAR